VLRQRRGAIRISDDGVELERTGSCTGLFRD
jgi:hypothetical protein